LVQKNVGPQTLPELSSRIKIGQLFLNHFLPANPKGPKPKSHTLPGNGIASVVVRKIYPSFLPDSEAIEQAFLACGSPTTDISFKQHSPVLRMKLGMGWQKVTIKGASLGVAPYLI